MVKNDSTRLDEAMRALSLSATELAGEIGVSSSLVARWQNGSRALPTKGNSVPNLAAALSRLDTNGVLDNLLAPHLIVNESKEQALQRFLSGKEMPGLPLTETTSEVQRSGEYVIQQRVLLGVKGFRKAALLMLDYLMELPPGQNITVCVHGGYDLWHGSLPFTLQFLQKLMKAIRRNDSFTLVSHNTEGLDGSPWFSVWWLVVQMRRILNICYYEGAGPEEYFVANIQGYWSGRTERDETAEDALISTLYTDPRNIRHDEAHCAQYIQRSICTGQYNFLEYPLGNDQYEKAWKTGGFPAIYSQEGRFPDGSFSSVTSSPSFGIMTHQEWESLCGDQAPPPLPDYLFSENAVYSFGSFRVILCREEIQAGLNKARLLNKPLSKLLHRKVYVPQEMLRNQLKRMIDAMENNPSFEVALMPRSAFGKLELELITWSNSTSLGWLQDGSESLLATDTLNCTSFSHAAEHVWNQLRQGWKRQKTVKTTLTKWLADENLDEFETDSTIVKNWDIFPKE